MMMQGSDPGPTDTHDWNDLRCFPSQGESDCVQAYGLGLVGSIALGNCVAR